MPARPTRRRFAALSFLALACVLAPAILPPSAQARVPFGFLGSSLEESLFLRSAVDVEREADLMVASGIESLRVPFHWSDAQPKRTMDAVPVADRPRYRMVDGIPTTFAVLDLLVGAAAKRRMRVLPVINTPPLWARRRPGVFGSPPSNNADFARFAAVLVRRYGPGGSFWAENPALPRLSIRTWQVWNEPNLKTSWAESTWAPGYVALLRAGRRAIKGVDPRAKIVLAGLTNASFDAIKQIYRRRGARRLFDIAAAHPYTKNPSGVMHLIYLVRKTMSRYGDSRKPLMVTEFGWPSSGRRPTQNPYGTTEAGQARRLRALLPLLAVHRKRFRLRAVYHYTWLGAEGPGVFPFNFAGLRALDPSGRLRSKPALPAFQRGALRLEGCVRKASVATRCALRARR